MKNVTYVFNKRDMEHMSDAVLHSTLDVEWKDLPENMSVLIHRDDVPLFVFDRVGTQHPDFALAFHRVVTVVEDFSQEFAFSWREAAAKSPTALLEWFTHFQTYGPADTVDLVKSVGSIIERELSELGCSPSQYWDARKKVSYAPKKARGVVVVQLQEDRAADTAIAFDDVAAMLKHFAVNDPGKGEPLGDTESRVVRALFDYV
jgi:hypothetical protein